MLKGAMGSKVGDWKDSDALWRNREHRVKSKFEREDS